MTPNNNFSVLPFYESLSEQDSRRWWQYGRVYPLFVDRVHFIPFQIIRKHLPTTLSYSYFSGGSYLNDDGNIVANPSPRNSGVARYNISGAATLYLYKIPHIPSYGDAVSVVAYNSGGTKIGMFTPATWDGDGLFTGSWTLPAGTASVAVYVKDVTITQKQGAVGTSDDPSPVKGAYLYAEDGTELDHYEDDAAILASYVQRFGDYDIITFCGRPDASGAWPIGKHYLEIWDGYNNFFSDIFTCVQDMTQYIKLEWWDNEDFVMDAGRIVYQPAEGVEFHNIAYLKAEIAKPEYIFEEEVERRDGMDFPTKQISFKTYRFAFMATEFLLDALRFVRMADHIVITDGERVYNPSAFLITPEWEKEGDVAGVDAQFQTDTIAKKIGLAYIRP